MATIVQDAAGIQPGPFNLTRTTMTASDTLTYVPGSKQVLAMYNTTASAVPVTITGSTATTVSPAGLGGTISVAAGKVVTVPASGTTYLNLDTISAYLSGTITLAGGTGCTAHLYV